MNKVYIVKVDYNQNIDGFPNIHRINSQDYLDIVHLLASEKHSFSENKIKAKANFVQLKKYDYISNDLNIPVFSEMFLNLIDIQTLNEIIPIPIELIDDTDNGLSCDKKFFTLNFNKQMNFCNVELSYFRKIKSRPNDLGLLKKPVLNVPETGFPNLFRIKESISFLFASQKVKDVVEKHNLKGFVFEEVETIPTAV